MKVCCVYRCKMSSLNSNESFFSFPKREDIFKEWKKIVPTKNYITKHSRICSKHFQNSCYEHVGKKRVLKYDAIPTIFNYDLENIKDVAMTSQTSKIEKELKTDVATEISPHLVGPTEEENKLRNKIKNLQACLHRKEKKLSKVTELLKHFKERGKCTDSLEEILLNKFSDFDLELFKNELDNTSVSKYHQRYSDKMKEFAQTLYFYSPKAYTCTFKIKFTSINTTKMDSRLFM